MRGALKLASAHPGRSTLLLLSLLVSSVLGGLGLVSIVPLLGLVIGGGAEPVAGVILQPVRHGIVEDEFKRAADDPPISLDQRDGISAFLRSHVVHASWGAVRIVGS